MNSTIRYLSNKTEIIPSFRKMDINPEVRSLLVKSGILVPTEIQQKVRDILFKISFIMY